MKDSTLQLELQQGPVVLDGALATELEKRHVVTDNDLWSATALINQASEIAAVHASYFAAGARIAITDTYQANPQAFEKIGLDQAASKRLIQKAVNVAKATRDQFANERQTKPGYVAGSIGPYGAYLADGSEYKGDYQLSETEYQEFHFERLSAIVNAGVDVLAIETMPNFAEVQALVKLIVERYPEQQFWVSFSIRDNQHLCDGTDLIVAANWVSQFRQAVAVGVNCTDLVTITAAIKYLHTAVTLPLVVYPNAGDLYDPLTKTWQRTDKSRDFREFVPTWINNGALLIGGCCRTTPEDIKTIATLVKKSEA